MGMKKMKNIPFRLNILYVKTRFKNKILEHKLVLGISIVITLFFIIKIKKISVTFYLQQLLSNSNNTYYDPFVSTIIGAVVGGVFTLLGSYLATKNNIRLQANIRQSRIIFAPIFDEIVQNKKRLEENPFPLYELIKEKSMPTHIFYDAWNRISNDYRRFEVNYGLKIYMDLLSSSILNYQKIVTNFVNNSHHDLGKILMNYGFITEENIDRSNFVEIIFSEIMTSENSDYLQSHSFSTEKIDFEQAHHDLRKKIKEIDGYNKLCIAQKEWHNVQLFGEKYVGELLKNINLRQVK